MLSPHGRCICATLTKSARRRSDYHAICPTFDLLLVMRVASPALLKEMYGGAWKTQRRAPTHHRFHDTGCSPPAPLDKKLPGRRRRRRCTSTKSFVILVTVRPSANVQRMTQLEPLKVVICHTASVRPEHWSRRRNRASDHSSHFANKNGVVCTQMGPENRPEHSLQFAPANSEHCTPGGAKRIRALVAVCASKTNVNLCG